MGIDTEKYFSPAVKRDAGAIAIRLAIALDAIADALVNVKQGSSIDTEVEAIRLRAREISDHFSDLSGWTDE